MRLEALLKQRGTGFDGSPPPAVLDLTSVEDLDLGKVDGSVRLFGAISAERAGVDQGPKQRGVAAGDEVLPVLIRVQTIDQVLGIAS